jgi:(p)ppGpp synthase/HD superfamily hydrolase
MNFKDTISQRQDLNTEELLDELSNRINLNDDNQKTFSALGTVMLAHSGDLRRKHDSCLNHILRVTLMTSDLSDNSAELVQAALLHDLVEDYPNYISGPIEDLWSHIENDYGKRVSQALIALTNPPEVEQEEKSDVHTPELYHRHVKHTLKNPDAALIKMSDFTDNLMTVYVSEDKDWKEELWRRYFPVIPFFEETFVDSKFKEDLNIFFTFIQSE